MGQYPRLYDKKINPLKFYPDYLNTYVERDVRSLQKIGDLSLFQKFLGLCAERIGQVLNTSALANKCKISVATAESWISILEATYIIFLLQPYHKNFGKRLIKDPKLYFYDPGLACSILRIESIEQLLKHKIYGSLFQTMALSEIRKQFYNQKRNPNFYFYRDESGREIDCIIEIGGELKPIEIKSSETFSQKYFDNIQYWYEITGSQIKNGAIIYCGNEDGENKFGKLVSWKNIENVVAPLPD